MNDYSGYPKSIKELTATCGSEWTPRDVLISILRDIDEGKIELTGLVCTYIYKTEDDDVEYIGYRHSNQNRTTAVGLLARAMKMIDED